MEERAEDEKVGVEHHLHRPLDAHLEGGDLALGGGRLGQDGLVKVFGRLPFEGGVAAPDLPGGMSIAPRQPGPSAVHRMVLGHVIRIPVQVPSVQHLEPVYLQLVHQVPKAGTWQLKGWGATTEPSLCPYPVDSLAHRETLWDLLFDEKTNDLPLRGRDLRTDHHLEIIKAFAYSLALSAPRTES